MRKVIFVNSCFPEDNGKSFDMYDDDYVKENATKENIESLELGKSCFEDNNVVGYIYKNNMYVQIYKGEIADLRVI